MEERDIIFKVGTKVKLRDYLKVGSYYGGVKFEDFCKQDFGKVLTITKVTPCNGYISTTKYEFEETPLEYTVEMLEPIKEKTMRYKAGDKVRIRKDLIIDEEYGTQVFVPKMKEYLGKETTICQVYDKDYTLKIDKGSWYWTDEMLEPAESECTNDFKIGDKVIFKPAEKDKLTGVFTVSEIDMDLGIPYIKLKEVKECMWFDPNRFLKVPVFNIGQVVTFKNVKDDRWPHSAYVEGASGKIASIDMHFYAPNKPGEDGNRYNVRSLRTGFYWYTTSASLELVPTIATLDDIKVTAANDPGPKGDIGIVTTAEALAQAVDNVKAPQFKIGDKVIIRSDLIPGKKYEEWDYSPEDGMGGWEFAAAMAKYMGKVATITGYVADDPNYCHLDIDKGTYSWIVNALLHYTPGSDYDLDRTIITYKQTKQNYENQLQREKARISRGDKYTGRAVCSRGCKAQITVGHLSYKEVTQ